MGSNNCLNCGKEVPQTEGKRERKYCDNNGACKSEYQRKHTKAEPKYVQYKTFQALKDKFTEAEKEFESKLIGLIENSNIKTETEKATQDLNTLGVSITKDGERIDPMSEKGNKIIKAASKKPNHITPAITTDKTKQMKEPEVGTPAWRMKYNKWD